jgi:hypothetical protein
VLRLAAQGRAITENVFAGDLPRLVVFVGRDLTPQTGCTMRSLRTTRRLRVSRELCADPPRLGLDDWLAAAAVPEWRPESSERPCSRRAPCWKGQRSVCFPQQGQRTPRFFVACEKRNLVVAWEGGAR